MRWRLYGSLGLAAGLAMPSLATAQQVRAGADFKVNTYTAYTQRRADVHVKANGEFIVAWAGTGAQDTSYYGVFGQRFERVRYAPRRRVPGSTRTPPSSSSGP